RRAILLRANGLPRLRQPEVIFVLDGDGNGLASSRRWPQPDGNFADRDYFAHFKSKAAGDASDQIYVSAPVLNRFTGMHTVFFSKPWRSARGEFLGVVGAGVKLEYFQHIYRSLTAIRGQSFVFLRRDGTVLVRHPETLDRGGERMPDASPWHLLVARSGGTHRPPEYLHGAPPPLPRPPPPGHPPVVHVAPPGTAPPHTPRPPPPPIAPPPPPPRPPP